MPDTAIAADLVALARDFVPWTLQALQPGPYDRPGAKRYVSVFSGHGVMPRGASMGLDMRAELSAPLTPENTASPKALERALLASAIIVTRGPTADNGVVVRLGGVSLWAYTEGSAREALLDALLS